MQFNIVPEGNGLFLCNVKLRGERTGGRKKHSSLLELTPPLRSNSSIGSKKECTGIFTISLKWHSTELLRLKKLRMKVTPKKMQMKMKKKRRYVFKYNYA